MSELASIAADAPPPALRVVAPPSEQQATAARDERLDLIRGMAMIIAVTVHLERPSLVSLFSWERLGVVSGAEAFVLLAGIVLAQMVRRTWEEQGPTVALGRLISRAGTVYRAYMVLVVGVWLLSHLPGDRVHELITFTDRASGSVYPTYDLGAPVLSQVLGFFMLRAGPHQVQVFGLYAVLIGLIAPLALSALRVGQTRLVLLLSFLGWAAYQQNGTLMPTGGSFEYGFPVLTWQFLFTLGLVAGHHWRELMALLEARKRWLFPLSVAGAVAFAIFSWNNPNPNIPSVLRLTLVTAADFSSIYGRYFLKTPLGLLRLVNDVTLFIAALYLLNVKPAVWKRALGWLVLPLGQNSLYVFFMHLPLVGLAALFGHFGAPSSGWVDLASNTGWHVAMIAALLVMVKTKFLFRFVPR
jgi:hypothetical protein